MNRNSQFVDVEGHIIRVADIVRVSEETDTTRGIVDEAIHDVNWDEEEQKKKRAYLEGEGSWLEDEFGHTRWSYKTFRISHRTKWIVILRRSRPVVLWKRSSYQKLKSVIEIN